MGIATSIKYFRIALLVRQFVQLLEFSTCSDDLWMGFTEPLS